MIYKRSSALFAEAQKVIPGGVNSPVRAFKAVGGDPIFVKEAKGAYLYDEDGNRLIDYINSWGPMILGHAHPSVVDAVVEKAKKGTSFDTKIRWGPGRAGDEQARNEHFQTIFLPLGL